MGMVWCISECIGQSGGGLLTRCFTDDAPAKALAVLGILYVAGFAMASLLPEEGQQSGTEYA
jgi:FSR family fosmidomycin resistance protein-like MFS transporter